MTESETADVQPPKLRTLGINLLAKASYEHPTLVVTLADLGLTEGIGRRVTYVRSDGVRTDENPILLGTTARYIFFFTVHRPGRRKSFRWMQLRLFTSTLEDEKSESSIR